MTTTKSLTALATIAVLLGSAGGALADPYADSAVSLQRVTSGTLLDGTSVNTSYDDGDDGSDATGPRDAFSGEPNKQTVLGYDPSTGAGGVLELDFTNNICVDGAGVDLLFHEIGSNEHALVEVSNDGGQNYVSLGEMGPSTNFRADAAGQISYFNRMRITATDFAGATTASGLDLDAVQCLNSLDESEYASTVDGCDLSTGETGLDVNNAFVFSDGFALTVDMNLCGAVAGGRNMYKVHFDYADNTDLDGDGVDDGPDTLDPNPHCATTADHTATYKGGTETGGFFTANGSQLSVDVAYADLGLTAGDQVLVWVETAGRKRVGDSVPTVEGGDRCDKPQVAGEVISVTVQ